MPGTTNFPTSLDAFPEIGPNAAENDLGIEHDVVHDNVHVALAAVQTKVGIDGSADTSSLDYKVAANTAALAAKAPIDSPTFTGTPAAPTPSGSDNSTLIATTAFVQGVVATAVTGLLDLKGSLDASSNPNYPAASKGDVYLITVAGKVGGGSGKSVDVGDAVIASADNAGGAEASVGTSWFVLEHNLAGVALLASPAFTGTPTAPTPSFGDDSTKLATTEFVQDAVAGGGGGSGIVQSIVAGTGIAVDDTDPANPIVSATGGGGSGYAEGTSFPGTPASGDKFYRTDRNLLYFYDGTRWLTVQLYEVPIAMQQDRFTGGSVTGFFALYPVRTDYQMFLTTFTLCVYATAADGSNYWTFYLDWQNAANAATNLATVNNSAGPASTWNRLTATIDAPLDGNARVLYLRATSTGSVANNFFTAVFGYRLIG